MARVLVAEDDVGLLAWLTEIILGAGHHVAAARDGLEALSLSNRQSFDLVVTDISMPNQDGFGLIRAMRQAHPEMMIIALSGKDPALLQDARLLGAAAALWKPVSSKAMLDCISEVLAGRSAVRMDPDALLCEHGSMKRLRGPFVLSDEMIDEEVDLRPGAFALGSLEGSGIFRVAWVGRSDTDVNNQLHVHVGSYQHFSFELHFNAWQAFEAECNLFHDLDPSDNPTHPLRPAGTAWKCPRCRLL